jgi:hypothetical protein
MTLAVNIAQGGANNVSFRNRIINGSMVIDQRNAGASVTPTASTYTLDRWATSLTQASKFSVQQNAGSVMPPTGFKNYLGITSLSSYSVTSGDLFAISQAIEGYNVADLGWGAAGAQSVTLSFWVRSSLTGTFGGSIINNGATRNYPFTYTISAANTWEQKSVTIPGDTTGTWLTTNGVGLYVFFGLGVGSTYSGTASAWSGTAYYSATGATSVVGTNTATFYITGVQLEAGTTASPFEYRPFTTEVQLCQRYFCKSSSLDVVATNGTSYGTLGMFSTGTVSAYAAQAGYSQWIAYPVTMRTEPATLTFINTNLSVPATAGNWSVFGAGWNNSTLTAQSYTATGFGLAISGNFAAGPTMFYGAWTASAEL